MGYVVVSAFGVAAIAFAVLSRYPARLTYFRYLSYGILACGVGFTTQISGFPPDASVNSIISTALYFTGALCVAEAVQRRSGETLGLSFHAIVLISSIFITAYFLFVDRNLVARTVHLNCGFGLVLLAAIWRRKELILGSVADRLLFWTIALIGFHFFPRTLLTVGGFTAQNATPFWTALQYSLLVITNAGATALLGVAGADIFATITRERDTDVLTGILNRRGLEAAVSAARKGRVEGVAIIADLDEFKAINDNFGHDAGDQVLKAVAQRLRKLMPPGDLIARVGGEEFVCVIWGDMEAGRLRAELLRDALFSSPIETTCGLLPVTASFGVAVHRPEEHLWDAVKRADAELYEAKRSGKNRVVTAAIGAEGPA
ncbi:MAG: GGDEF domain-containing protein [Devosia sp.]|uniref:GGDEF domain-containing protein n=1 Tax=Devosia sp. TaxID=1871048 RepID=UPI001A0B13E1|nr:GGDEF domain-containing protein [Devosia sp.]MBF0678438.1 GGDEF domain-containing protein [Devosia sp.]